MNKITLQRGNNLELLRQLPDNSIDAIVTDPPYGISFMGRKWDYDVPSVALWQECLRVLKPGGYLLAFAGTRTQHRMAVRIEDAGFEIRDMIAWVYGSGFPKSMDVSKAIDKVAPRAGMFDLFAAHFADQLKASGKTQKEVAVLFPSKTGGITGCVWNWANGANVPTVAQWRILQPLLNLSYEWLPLIERIEAEREVVDQQRGNLLAVAPGQDNDRSATTLNITAPATTAAHHWQGWGTALKPALEPITVARKPFSGTVAENVLQHGTGAINVDGCRVGESSGRWPANFIHDGSHEVIDNFPESDGQQGYVGPEYGNKDGVNAFGDYGPRNATPPRNDSGSAARFFYCAKASRFERNAGLEDFEKKPFIWTESKTPEKYDRTAPAQNAHPTVKPIDLMRYLCRLITPPGGTVLDPFMGSGTTGIAAKLEGFNFIGMELNAEYVEIAQARIDWWTAERWKAYELGLREKPPQPQPQTPTLFDEINRP